MKGKQQAYTCKMCKQESTQVRLISLFAKINGQDQSALILVCSTCIKTGTLKIPLEEVFPGAVTVEKVE